MRRTMKPWAAAAGVAVSGALLLGDWNGSKTRAQAAAPAAQGAAVPLTGKWTVDRAHSNVNFAIRHMGLATIRGRFDEYAGTIVADEAQPEKSSVEFTIQAASIDTDVKMRDDHLRTADFLDVEKHPQITFRSSRVEKGRDGGFIVRGPLNLHGTPQEIALPFKVAGPIKDPRAGARIGIETQVRINRQDYGIKYHQVLDNGALALANDVDIAISLEAVPAR